MAIFGSLSDIALPDLLSMLGERMGILEIWDQENARHLQIRLGNRVLLDVRSRGQRMDALQAQAILAELIKSSRGTFEFRIGQPKDLQEGTLNMPIEELLLSLAQMDDEERYYQNSLAPCGTRFRITQSNPKVKLEEPIRTFWEKSRYLLEQRTGASAKEIASALGLPLNQVRLMLHKLRILGVVMPSRTFKKENASWRKGVIGRMLRALMGKVRS